MARSKIPTVTRERVSPGLAKEWMRTLNDNNRPLSDDWAEELSDAKRSGEWVETCDTVKFNTKRKLMDGQHRLTMIILTGQTVYLWVARNVPDEAFNVLDQGRKRYFQDMLARDGEHNYVLLSGSVRNAWVLMHKQPMSRMKEKLRIPVAYEVLKRNPKIRDSLTHMEHLKARTLGQTGLLTAFHHLASRNEKPFWDSVVTGANLKIGSPALTLRNRLMESKASVEPMSRETTLALFIKSWNAHMHGEKMTSAVLKKSDFGKTVVVTWKRQPKKRKRSKTKS